MASPDPTDFTLHAEPYTDGTSAILALRCPGCLGYELGNWDPRYDDNATPSVADILAATAAHEHVLIG
ncbi:hypothetical protein [Streptomyces spectabilis]|uniref:Uncharacterized protein n=1 Tax=Streptomyces spectabilis TaxID=68270 RepID=A0A5P2X2E3_STRST|nr:hypothetical protein [Streptomyces spectabilis]MBB5108301.1 hypothetical protein [Streptomyces spectabilis]MCI3901060.1 hypothetical protein [Streptomyces spectabilis]QEV58558.1 hypothetical protein CP982_07400 [Streptomyces spectabilis]GGV45726.1 hypothetical protein GCM10010245_71630 [Streptomyces spectabilis]